MRAARIVRLGLAVGIRLVGTSCRPSAKSARLPGAPTTFSGSTASQSEPGSSSSTTLNSVTPTPAGCIDNVTFGFSRTLAPSVTAYESTTASPAVLVVKFKHATLVPPQLVLAVG